MALQNLRSAFLRPATAAIAGFAALTAVPATAQDAQVHQTSAVTISEDADGPADEWVQKNPGDMAISVHLGDSSRVPTENIEAILRSDFAANGVDKIEFFWERGGPHGTTVAYHTDDYVFGPYGLDKARDHVAETAAQFRFNRELAFNLD